MSSKTMKKPIAAAIGAAFVGTLAATGSIAAENPFGVQELKSGYMQLAEGKCGEGKCGGAKADKNSEGKCGEAKCGGNKKPEGKCGEGKCGGDKKPEGKCGEGKCGGSK